MINPDAGALDAPFDATGCPLECDDGNWCNGAERCDPSDDLADVAGCVPGIPECGGTVCDESTDSCGCEDADGDGVLSVECGGSDCDDNDANRYPGNVEVCDPGDRDEDCDPMTFGVRDQDMDGYADSACCNEGACGDDCDDTRASVHPSEAEVCDDLDNDCDGTVDEGVLRTFYVDGDEDGFGDATKPTFAACFQPAGYAESGGDCADDQSDVHPAAAEECDGRDEDCNGIIDDRPGPACGCVDGATASCSTNVGLCSIGQQTCVDGVWSACTGVTPVAEICDGQDNDCDGGTDEALSVVCYLDSDNDGYPRSGASPTSLCPIDGACPIGFTSQAPTVSNRDCNDDDSTIRPNATEVCDGVDNNCRLGVDEGLLNPCGSCGAVPAEVCDAVDNDCDGSTDEGASTGVDTGVATCSFVAPPSEGATISTEATGSFSRVINFNGDEDLYRVYVDEGESPQPGCQSPCPAFQPNEISELRARIRAPENMRLQLCVAQNCLLDTWTCSVSPVGGVSAWTSFVRAADSTKGCCSGFLCNQDNSAIFDVRIRVVDGSGAPVQMCHEDVYTVELEPNEECVP